MGKRLLRLPQQPFCRCEWAAESVISADFNLGTLFALSAHAGGTPAVPVFRLSVWPELLPWRLLAVRRWQVHLVAEEVQQ